MVPSPRCVLAPNPGPMTGPGTNQYLLGPSQGSASLLLDVASLGAENRARLAAAATGVERIVVTHGHPDHVGGVPAAAALFDAPVLAHPRHADTLEASGVPRVTPVADGAEIPWSDGRLRAIWTPGHDAGHVCLHEPEQGWLFTGDTVLSTGTTVIPYPDGDMAAYLASLRRLRALSLTRIFPGHGPPIDDPYRVLDDYLQHRLLREQQIVAYLGSGPASVEAIVAHCYAGLHPVLQWAAAQTVRAHLAKLVAEGRVQGPDGETFRVPAGRSGRED